MSEHDADAWTHWFVFGVYLLPVFGALLSDGLLGKYRTILWLSIVYCFGHFALAINDTRFGLAIGLILICLGRGWHQAVRVRERGRSVSGPRTSICCPRYSDGSTFRSTPVRSISSLLCPYLLEHNHPHLAFGIPGVAMVLATISFWLGRKKFVHVPPAGLGFLQTTFSREGLGALGRLCSVYVFIAVFWALWDQSNGVEWTLQAAKMDLSVAWLPWLAVSFSPFYVHAGMGLTLSAGQVQTANPVLILLFIPLVNYVIYPAIDKVFKLTPLRRIGIGLFITSLSFLVIAYIQQKIDAGFKPNVNWQFLAYVIITWVKRWFRSPVSNSPTPKRRRA